MRSLTHYQFTSWPDYGVPRSADAFLDFLFEVRSQQVELTAELGEKWAGHPLGPPIIVHCSAGIGRTGTVSNNIASSEKKAHSAFYAFLFFVFHSLENVFFILAFFIF